MQERTRISTLALAALAIMGTAPAQARAQDPPTQEAADPYSGPAFTHLRHVSETFRGTPKDMGLLPAAVAETEIAVQHATLAARDPADVDAVRRHVGHVLHALDPSAVENGPGLGYGAVRAAERTAHYISLAAASDGSTEAIETHSNHIATAARHAMTNGEAAAELAREILAATAPPEEEADSTREQGAEAEGDTVAAEEEAGEAEEGAEDQAAPVAEEDLDIAAAVDELASLTRAMLEGVDADGDDRVGWQDGEGGLAQAQQHLQLLRRAEGLGG